MACVCVWNRNQERWEGAPTSPQAAVTGWRAPDWAGSENKVETIAVKWCLAYSDSGSKRVPLFNIEMALLKGKKKRLKRKGLVRVPWRQSRRWRSHRYWLRLCYQGTWGGGASEGATGLQEDEPEVPSAHPTAHGSSESHRHHRSTLWRPTRTHTHTHMLKRTFSSLCDQNDQGSRQ